MTAASVMLYGLLIAMFGWSGASKVLRPTPASITFVRFGLTRHPRRTYARCLGAVELGLSLGLLTTGDQFLMPAGVLLAVFALLIAVSISKGRSFACACFGGAGEQISAWSVLRNATIAVSAFIVEFTQNSSTIVTANDRLNAALIAGIIFCGYGLVAVLRETRPFTSPTDEQEGWS